jgi:hypothetical protein
LSGKVAWGVAGDAMSSITFGTDSHVTVDKGREAGGLVARLIDGR